MPIPNVESGKRKGKKMTKYSDDGYDYNKENRDGYVDDYVSFVQEWRKTQKEKAIPQKEEDRG
jgi:hypothetical protein